MMDNQALTNLRDTIKARLRDGARTSEAEGLIPAMVDEILTGRDRLAKLEKILSEKDLTIVRLRHGLDHLMRSIRPPVPSNDKK